MRSATRTASPAPLKHELEEGDAFVGAVQATLGRMQPTPQLIAAPSDRGSRVAQATPISAEHEEVIAIPNEAGQAEARLREVERAILRAIGVPVPLDN